jgi:hypothetical protein
MRKGAAVFIVPLLLAGAFFLWLAWPQISWKMGWGEKKPPPKAAAGSSREKIFEDDRRKLDEVLRQRQSK